MSWHSLLHSHNKNTFTILWILPTQLGKLENTRKTVSNQQNSVNIIIVWRTIIQWCRYTVYLLGIYISSIIINDILNALNCNEDISGLSRVWWHFGPLIIYMISSFSLLSCFHQVEKSTSKQTDRHMQLKIHPSGLKETIFFSIYSLAACIVISCFFSVKLLLDK